MKKITLIVAAFLLFSQVYAEEAKAITKESLQAQYKAAKSKEAKLALLEATIKANPTLVPELLAIIKVDKTISTADFTAIMAIVEPFIKKVQQSAQAGAAPKAKKAAPVKAVKTKKAQSPAVVFKQEVKITFNDDTKAFSGN